MVFSTLHAGGMQAPDKLPLAASASIFIRTDEERIDIVRSRSPATEVLSVFA